MSHRCQPVLAQSRARDGAARLLLTLIAGAALYGAAAGSWHGARLAAYSAIKLPLALLATAALTTPFASLLLRALGFDLTLTATARLAVRCLALAALLLASLSPVAAFFTWTAPAPSPVARTPHNLLYLLHVGLVGGSGVVSLALLRRVLAARAPSRHAARRALLCWVAIFALVGGEVAWALRPFLGSVYAPVALVRPDALEGNVYEFIWTDILPHLVHRLAPHGEFP